MDFSWVVVRTHPRRERWAAENVSVQGFVCYFPCIAELVLIGPKYRRQRVMQIRPLFISYLFVSAQPTLSWRRLLCTFGVSSVLMGHGEKPLTVRDDIIRDLRNREDADGLVQLPTRPTNHGKFNAGQRVRIVSGHFTGANAEIATGIYEGTRAQERVRVLLDFLGRRTSTLIGEGLLQAA